MMNDEHNREHKELDFGVLYGKMSIVSKCPLNNGHLSKLDVYLRGYKNENTFK